MTMMLTIRAVPDLFFPIRPEPDLKWQIDRNFTNLMCKTLWTYEWFEFFFYFLCCCYQYDFLNFWISYLHVFRPTSLSYYSSKLSNVWENRLFKSGKTIRPRWDFCRSRISAGFGNSARFRPELEEKSGTALITRAWREMIWYGVVSVCYRLLNSCKMSVHRRLVTSS